jgi:mRNA-degrading endonuclease RelE of RelBE toxin-antitoxin system
MKIIITEYFEKILKKVASDLNISDLIQKINIESKNFINLKNPYFKVKIKSKTKTYRLLLLYEAENLIILFINIFDKKDKIY